MFSDKKKQKGITLLELMLAMTMLGIVMIGTSGYSTRFFGLTQQGQQKMDMHEDLNIAMRYIENQMLVTESGRDLRYQIKITPTVGEATVIVLLNVRATTDNIVSTRVCEATISYGPDNYFETNCPDGITTRRVLKNGFKPWARLKDYDQNGFLNSVVKRAACLESFQKTCIDVSCPTPVDGSYELNFDIPELALDSVSTTCLDKSVFPFLELKRDRGLLYLSLQPKRKTIAQVDDNTMAGVTKAVALHPIEVLVA